MGLQRLKSLLRASADEAGFDAIASLVERAVPEDFDLDFKRDLYAPGDPGALSFAKDVAAFANSGGGVVVIGIDETNGVAVGVSLVTFPAEADLERRLEDAVANKVFPKPSFRVYRRCAVDEQTKGFVVVVVPPSALGPHAVREGEQLRYLVREQRKNRSLAEYEVAQRYRERFSSANASEARLDSVMASGGASWSPMGLFVEGVCVPEQSGRAPVSHASLEQIQERLLRMPRMHPLSRSRASPRVGYRRIRVRSPASALTPYSIEFHEDGSSYFGCALRDPGDPGEFQLMLQGALFIRVHQLLAELETHCRRALVEGDRRIRVRIGHATGVVPSNLRLRPLGEIFELPEPSGPFESRLLFPAVWSSEREAMLGLRGVLLDLFQAFGEPDVAFIREDGSLPARALSLAFGQSFENELLENCATFPTSLILR